MMQPKRTLFRATIELDLEVYAETSEEVYRTIYQSIMDTKGRLGDLTILHHRNINVQREGPL